MASRRMFSKTITNSSLFLTMPHSCQALYYQLGMNADDDGYCEHVMIMRMGAFQPDDLKILHAKGLVHVFDDMVLVILDWKENNEIKRDRYKKSKYLETHTLELLSPECIQNVSKMDTQVRLGKVRLDNNNILPEKTGNKSEYVEIMEVFSAKYESETNYPFKADKRDYIILTKLVKDYGADAVKDKINILAVYCSGKITTWFAKNWSDFTIRKLSSNWNNIIPVITKEQQVLAEIKEHEANVNRILEEKTN